MPVQPLSLSSSNSTSRCSIYLNVFKIFQTFLILILFLTFTLHLTCSFLTWTSLEYLHYFFRRFIHNKHLIPLPQLGLCIEHDRGTASFCKTASSQSLQSSTYTLFQITLRAVTLTQAGTLVFGRVSMTST